MKIWGIGRKVLLITSNLDFWDEARQVWPLEWHPSGSCLLFGTASGIGNWSGIPTNHGALFSPWFTERLFGIHCGARLHQTDLRISDLGKQKYDLPGDSKLELAFCILRAHMGFVCASAEVGNHTHTLA